MFDVDFQFMRDYHNRNGYGENIVDALRALAAGEHERAIVAARKAQEATGEEAVCYENYAIAQAIVLAAFEVSDGETQDRDLVEEYELDY